MNSESFNNRLELAILLSDCLESVTKELDNQINDRILQMKSNKVKVAVTQFNNKLTDFISPDIQMRMGDYCDGFRDCAEKYIKEFNHK